MFRFRYIVVSILCSLRLASVQAGQWNSYFAYNNVTQIALTPDKVFALSDGSLFSLDKQSEDLHLYNRQSGLHGTDISCISYDPSSEVLIIAYSSGKVDLLSTAGVQYISGLYDKHMTQRKDIYNITLHNRTAYLSTHFGVQTLDMRDKKFVDSYWLRPNAEETPIYDVKLTADSIYAFGEDSLYCAALKDNIVDYHFWKREPLSGRITPDSEKGIHYQDGDEHWYAGNNDGIIRQSMTERVNYKPQGPQSNIPYRLHCAQGKLYVTQGGRWASQYMRPGMVMIFDGKQWTNIPTDSISKHCVAPVRDFMNVAVDPADSQHYFVTSYGTGLYEFHGTTLTRKYLPAADNALASSAPSDILQYTRLDFATYDPDGNLWMLVNGAVENGLVCLDAKGEWHGLPVKVNNAPFPLHTSAALILDNHHPERKWIATARNNTTLFLMDDGGTRFDAADDRIIGRNNWTTEDGQNILITFIFDAMQTRDGRVWLATDQGLIIIPDGIDYFHSDACVRPHTIDHNGENPMTSMRISAVCEDQQGNIWVGTETLGIYVLNSDATQILARFTTDNSAMPSNAVLCITCNENGVMYIGTGGGLVSYDPNDSDEPGSGLKNQDEEDLDMGSVMRWKLHFSYDDPQEIAATPTRIYGMANGALFYVDRADDQMHYLSKATGLNGSTVTHIAYDALSRQLLIAYQDGRIDLLGEDDEVRQMPDLYMKASSVPVTINAIATGKKHSFLAMPFGILSINPKRAEVVETYYIGDSASDVNVLQIVEMSDSLYAFTEDTVYSASLQDNLIDYSYWHTNPLPLGTLTQAFGYHDELYTLIGNRLYRLRNNQWKQVLSNTIIQWVHASDGQVLAYISGQGLFRLTDTDQLTPVTARYTANDALYSQGEYWVAQANQGLVRLGTDGDDAFLPDGPNSNFGYFMTSAHGRIYSCIGGRWASQYSRYTKINIYDGWKWTGIDNSEIWSQIGSSALDPVSIAVAPDDAEHFYVATYGTGLVEFNHGKITHHTKGTGSCTLREAVESTDPNLYKLYTRVDGAMTDKDGNLWVLNATTVGQPVHVVTPDGKWHALALRAGGKNLVLTTPTGIWVDRRNSQRKWFMDQRHSPAVVLLDDGGTPTDVSDDRCVSRSSFVDQNGNTITPMFFDCMTQDLNNRIWIGTHNGILVIPSTTDFFTSNAVRRIIIPRNDGTGLGDYLLGDEHIKCLAPDGGNRMWIGTANSGLYLIEDDTITVAHFTENNSLLPSNFIQSITIEPTTGEVFVGTDKGIASYRSDASEGREDYSHAYAYPNPVRPDYGGNISITGLMANSVVNIVDAGGNLVCKTRSHGGTAVWDGRLLDGRRATPGVYSALCNEPNGGHTVVKILVIH